MANGVFSQFKQVQYVCTVRIICIGYTHTTDTHTYNHMQIHLPVKIVLHSMLNTQRTNAYLIYLGKSDGTQTAHFVFGGAKHEAGEKAGFCLRSASK